MSQEVDLLINNGVVVTVDGDNRVFMEGGVAVREDRIVAVGRSEDLTRGIVAKRTIDAHNKLIMPGLIDTYHHAGHGMIKGIYRTGMGPGLGWPPNELYFHGTTPDWWHAEGLLTAVERVKFGVTTGVTIMGGTPARTDSPIFAERNSQAVEKVGIRAVIGVGPPDPFLNLGHGWSGTFFEGGRAIKRPFTYEQTIEVSRDVIGRLKGGAGGRVQTMLAVPYLCGMNPEYMTGPHHYPYSKDDAKVMRDKALEARRIADEFSVIIHTHGARGVFEWAEKNYGRETLGEILGSNVIFAHANGLTDLDISIMKECDVAATAVPFAAWNTSLGTCPIVKLIQSGVRVAISTDGAAPFHVTDLFVDIHRAMFMQWMENHSMSLLQAGRAIRLVTIEAAALLGMEKEIGSLEVGKKADIILIDLDQPHLVPFEDPANMIAFYVRGNDVETVIVDGAVLMEGRTVKTVNEADVLRYAREEIAGSFKRVNIAHYLEHTSGFWQGLQESAS